MLRKVIFVFILSSPFILEASRPNMDKYSQPIEVEQKNNEKIRRSLIEMGLGKILDVDKKTREFVDEKAPMRLEALYWVHTLNVLKDGVEVPRYKKLDEKTETLIPLAFNNILEKVKEQDWKSQPSEDEITEWKMSDPNPLLRYVPEKSSKTPFTPVDESTYYMAYKIYQDALKDRDTLQKHFKENPDPNLEADSSYQIKNDLLSMALGDYKFSYNNLQLEMGQQILKLKGYIAPATRAPASTGEHNGN